MAEWSNASVLKTEVWETGPRVRIPLPPQHMLDPDTKVLGFLHVSDGRGSKTADVTTSRWGRTE